MNTTDGDLCGCLACGVGNLVVSCIDGIGETGLGLGYGVCACRLASVYKFKSICRIVFKSSFNLLSATSFSSSYLKLDNYSLLEHKQ